MPGEVEMTRKLVELLDEGKTGTIVGAVIAAIVLLVTYDSRPVDPIDHRPVRAFDTHITQYKILGHWTTDLPQIMVLGVAVLLAGALIGLGAQTLLSTKKTAA